MNKTFLYFSASTFLLGTFGFFSTDLREAYEEYQHESKMKAVVVDVNSKLEQYNSGTRSVVASLSEDKELVISRTEQNGQLMEAVRNPFQEVAFRAYWNSTEMNDTECNNLRVITKYNGKITMTINMNNGYFVKQIVCNAL